METEDLLQGSVRVPAQTEKRYTAHSFAPTDPSVLIERPSGSPIRIPTKERTSEWPPDVQFNATYVIAVMHNFGVDV